MTAITNTAKLQRKIDESGLRPNEIATAWGVSMPTYYKLKSGESEFTATMIKSSVKIFGLTKRERDSIFFGEERE